MRDDFIMETSSDVGGGHRERDGKPRAKLTANQVARVRFGR
jgi:hypothetical protein